MPTVFIAGVLTFLVDQITKYWVVHVLELASRPGSGPCGAACGAGVRAAAISCTAV